MPEPIVKKFRKAAKVPGNQVPYVALRKPCFLNDIYFNSASQI